MAGPSGSTGKLALPYPIGADTVDVPRDVQALATKLDPLVATQTDLAGKSTIPALVTSLPSAPVDGQECYVLADASNGVIWNLRYRAAASSSYKWEFVGGAALRAVGADASINALAAAGWYPAGPTILQIAAPLPGEYEVTHNAGIARPPNYGVMDIYAGIYNGSTFTQDFRAGFPQDFPQWVTVPGAATTRVATATAALQQWFYASVPCVFEVRNRSMQLRPIRVG